MAAGLIGGIAFLVPKIRRLAAARVQPRLAPAWANLRNLVNNPGQLGRLFAGAAVTQLLLATGLGLAPHAVGASASLTSLLGGIAPVPGGMGVMEASYGSGERWCGCGATRNYDVRPLPPEQGGITLRRVRKPPDGANKIRVRSGTGDG